MPSEVNKSAVGTNLGTATDLRWGKKEQRRRVFSGRPCQTNLHATPRGAPVWAGDGECLALLRRGNSSMARQVVPVHRTRTTRRGTL